MLLKLLVACFVIFLLTYSLVIHSAQAESKIALPPWMKNTAEWWAEGKTNTKKFSTSLVWLSKTQNFTISQNDVEKIPEWLKKSASLWSTNRISDNDFLNLVKFLMENNILTLTKKDYAVLDSKDLVELPYHGYSPYFKTFAYPINIVNQGDNKPRALEIEFELLPQYAETYKEIAVWDTPHRYAVIVPLFTNTAYWDHGFYDYYRGNCDMSCLTKKIEFDKPMPFSASGNAVAILNLLGYDTITDLDVDRDPTILQHYEKIILLHNEYVTKKEFDAITHHPHVIYLFANPLYAQVSVNYENDTITLMRGHGYPTADVKNAFNWKFDNSQHEYDTSCSNNSFYKVDNGIMWDCYPDKDVFTNMTLLKTIKNS